MKYAVAHFTGRLAGAIGVFHHISAPTKGKDEEAMRLFLYEKYDHIQGLMLVEITQEKYEDLTRRM